MSHAREDDTYPLLAEPLGWVAARARRRRRRGRRHDAARLRQPRGPPPRPAQVPRRGARHRVDARPRSAGGSGSTIAPAGRAAAVDARGVPRHARRRHRPAGAVRQGRRPRRRRPAHGAARAGRRRHGDRAADHRPPGPAAATASTPDRIGEVEDRLRGPRRAAGRRRRARCAGWRSPARRCRRAVRRSARPSGCCPTW